MIKMMKLGALSATLALLGASGCNVPLTSDFVYPMSVPMPGAPASETIRTAAPGEIVLSQSLAHAGFLELENTVAPADRVWQGIVTYFPKMEQGLKLYPALRVGKARMFVACSLEDVAPHAGGMGSPKRAFPICLELPESALVAVGPGESPPANATPLGGSLWLATGAQAQSGFIYWDLAGNYAEGSEGPNFTLTEPARLRISAVPSETPGSTLRLALRYAADQSGARLETIYLTGEQQVRTTRRDIPLSQTDAFPRTIETAGAAIELLAIRDGVLAYRVRRNFPSDRFVISNLPD